ncbi:S-layer protein [Candidatus Micrarchaeota archaeon]|nr:S-layer protein [Candidatus Micrarchaeota archaeon]
MKSLSIKRIAAIAAGAALVGSAFAAAVDTDTTNLANYKFFSNAQPDVQIVVGKIAAASDGIAAANIAAMIGNLAYTSTKVAITGTDLVKATSGNETVTGGTAVIDVTVPGVSPTSAYQVKSYIGLDSSNRDSVDSYGETVRNASSSWNGDLSASALGTTGVEPTVPLKITGDKTALLQYNGQTYYKVVTPKSLNIKEEQKIFLFGKTYYYATDDVVEAKTVKVGYEVTFTDPLPYCLETTKTDALCAESDKTTKNHVQIKFLGGTWTVMDMSYSASTAKSTITLGKETAYSPIMKLQDTLTAENGVKVTLTDISTPTGTSYLPYASFKIVDAAGSEDTLTIQQGSSTEKFGVVISVEYVFGGITQTNYARVAVYSSRLELTSDTMLPTTYGYWTPNIYNTTTTGGGQAITKIFLYDTTTDYNLKTGESVALISGMPGYKITFTNTDLTDSDYDPLTFSLVEDQTLKTDLFGDIAVDVLKVTSGKATAFRPTINGSAISGNNIFYIGLGNSTSNWSTCKFFTKPSSSSLTYGNTTADMPYYYSSSEAANIQCNQTAQNITIRVPEYTVDNAGYSASVNDANVNETWLLYDQSIRKLVSTTGSATISTTAPWGYDTPANVEDKTVTPRGSILNGYTSTSAQIKYATKVAHALYTMTGGAAAAAANVASYTMAPGDSKDIGGGYKVALKSVSATGAGGACTVTGLDNLAANPANVVATAKLNTKASPLVVTDDAATSSKLIVVGGPVVNTVADTVLGGKDKIAAGQSMVKVVGDKVVVAGYTAADTTAAAEALIDWLNQNRDALQR